MTDPLIGLTPEQRAKIAEAKRLSDLPYDGVVGTLPDWFPMAVRSEFLRTRRRLLEEYTPQQVLAMIQYLEGTLVLDGLYVSIPKKRMPDIGNLLEYKRAVDLGPRGGLDLLLGKNLASNERRGKKVLQGAQSGHASVHGTREEKKERWARFQKEIDALHSAFPGLSYEDLCTRVAAQLHVHRETVKLHTNNPKK